MEVNSRCALRSPSLPLTPVVHHKRAARATFSRERRRDFLASSRRAVGHARVAEAISKAGDPASTNFLFCGNDAIAGFTYCLGHARMAYRAPASRR